MMRRNPRDLDHMSRLSQKQADLPFPPARGYDAGRETGISGRKRKKQVLVEVRV